MRIFHSIICIKAIRWLECDNKITRKDLSNKYPSCANEIVNKLNEHRAVHFSTKGHTIIKSRFNEVKNEYTREMIIDLIIIIKYVITIIIGGGVFYFIINMNININQQNNYIQQHNEIMNNQNK